MYCRSLCCLQATKGAGQHVCQFAILASFDTIISRLARNLSPRQELLGNFNIQLLRSTAIWLQAEVWMHEPCGALDGGASGGLECLHAICDSAAEFLIPGGFLGLEMGGELICIAPV